MGASSPGADDPKTEAPAGRLILVAAAAVVIGAVVAAAVVAATGNDPVFDEGTPEAAVQRYLDAMIDGDESAAHDTLSEELRRECSLADLREQSWQADGVRVTLRDVHVDGASAEVEVTIHEGGGGMFGEEPSYPERFILAKTAGVWVVAEQPWPIYFCSEES